MRFLLAGLVGLAGATGIAHANPINLLNNGSFEQGSGSAGQTGSFTGWTVTDTAIGSDPGVGPQRVQYGANATVYGDNVSADPFSYSPDASGHNAVFFVDDSANESLSQSVSLTGGTTYQVGFDFFETNSGAGNSGAFSLSALLGGTSLVTVTSSSPTASGTWYHVFDTFTAAQTLNSASFVFDYLSGGAPAKDVIVDDVYLEALSTPVPEPASLAVLAVGLAALYAARRQIRAA